MPCSFDYGRMPASSSRDAAGPLIVKVALALAVGRPAAKKLPEKSPVTPGWLSIQSADALASASSCCS
jgi:hypothetical protein